MSKLGNVTIFINTFKREDDEPDYRGKLDINGKTYDCALWINKSISGVVINMSGQITEPRDTN